MIKKGTTQEKVLLLLLGGLALSLTRSPRGYYKILKKIEKGWKDINRRQLMYSINALYKSQLVNQINNRDGTTTYVLNKAGKQLALRFNLDTMTISKHKWDKKWRIVMSDIPERIKKVRDIMRYHLKRLGFIELQHSVFVLPYECRSEIEYIIEFYNTRRFVRYVEASYIDNELDLKHRFHLL